jgi:hypothetical protein
MTPNCVGASPKIASSSVREAPAPPSAGRAGGTKGL